MILGENDNLRTRPEFPAVSEELPEKRLIDSDEDPYTFNNIVNKACEGLMARQIKYSIRRIKDMEKRLSCMEQELEEFLKPRIEKSMAAFPKLKF